MRPFACLLSTHADRQGDDISFTVCLFVCLFFVILCVCTVTDFSAEDKASGVKFCTVVHRRPGQGISHFGGTLLSQQPKIGRIGQPPESKVYYSNLHRKRHDRNTPFVEYGAACGRRSACVDKGQSPLTYLLKHRPIIWNIKNAN